MSLPTPPHPLLEEILRTVARRYRLPPMTVTSADIKNVNPATTLPIVIEQARQAVADGQAPDPALKRRFIEALAHMIRDAMRADAGDPAFQAIVLRHRVARVREFASLSAHADAPNEKWLTDITEFPLPAGKVYLSPIVDCFDGKVVSWSIGTRPDAQLVNTMLDGAIGTLTDGARPVIHSDRGGHYRWPGWLQRIRAAWLISSMSRKGCSPDNAACEGFFGRLKNEMYYGRDWVGTTIERFMRELDSYIRWYSERRIQLSLGAMSPTEYQQHLGIAA